jgi:hypothetical protein
MAERSLWDELPRIRRARGYRLYDTAGRRYLDLWQADGGAILGHRGAGMVTAVKAALDRGLAAPLPTAWEHRLLAALGARFPAYRSFRLFVTRERALQAAGRALGAPVDEEDVADPALGSKGDGRVGRWRPFLPDEPSWPVVLPVLPCTLGGSPSVVGFRDALSDDEAPSDPVAGVAAVASLRGLAGLARAMREDPFDTRDLAGAPGWERRGPYVAPALPAAAYPAVFRAFLARGVLLSPGYRGPSILPGEASAGERRLVVSLFHSIPGG